MDIVGSAKKLQGGRLRLRVPMRRHVIHKRTGRTHVRTHKKTHKAGAGMQMVVWKPPTMMRKRRGRGVVSDILGKIPLLGSFLGPIAQAFGGRLTKRQIMAACRGRGLAPMRYKRPYVGIGGSIRRGHYRIVNGRRVHVRPTKVRGRGLAPMRYKRPYVGIGGLLNPAGGTIRRGHYRYVNGRRVHVRPSVVHGRGMHLYVRKKRPMRRRRGGYMPHTW
jgi:hypothetical protein